MITKTTKSTLIASAVFLLVLAGCRKDDLQPAANANSFSSEVAAKWFNQELLLLKTTTGVTPPVASRALGYTGVTLYESLVPGMSGYLSLKNKLSYSYNLPAYNSSVKYFWPAVANAALHSIVKSLFANATPANLFALDSLYTTLHAQQKAQLSNEDIDASEAYGEATAKVIFNWSNTDGIARSFTNYTAGQYTPPVFDGAWVPTAPAYQPPLLPFWGDNRPFIAKDVDADCLPPVPASPYSTSPTSVFYQQALEVYQVNKNLTSSQRDIALFWNDGGGSITPPGHNMSIVTQVIVSAKLPLFDASVVYAKTGMAMADAFIACWKGKYTYNVMRPITFIQQNIDANWTPLITTPPFPTYCSGHATVSGATAAVLTQLFGDNIPFTDHTYESVYGTRGFQSFNEVAQEAAESRLYGGIHYRIDNSLGLQRGALIGKNVASLDLKK